MAGGLERLIDHLLIVFGNRSLETVDFDRSPDDILACLDRRLVLLKRTQELIDGD